MTEQNLKDILMIQEWEEINTVQQFFTLMSCYHELAPGVKAKVIGKIRNIGELTGKLQEYCEYGMIDYEPTVILTMSKIVEELKQALGKGEKVRGPENRKRISAMYSEFSEWFGAYGEVQCSVGTHDFICNIAEAVELAIENEEGNGPELSMMMLTKERVFAMEHEADLAMGDFDIDVDLLAQILGEEPDLKILNKNFKKFIQ